MISHPDVLQPKTKEIHYYDLDFHRGEPWYRAHFPLRKRMDTLREESRTAVLTGESSPYYFSHPQCPSKIKSHIPEARFIVLLRNPIERAYSHFQHNCRLGWETLSFEKALEAEEERICEDRRLFKELHDHKGHQFGKFSYRERGKYVESLKRWYALFPPNQFLIIESSRFFGAPEETLASVNTFLGLKDFNYGITLKSNAGEYSPIEDGLRDKLSRYFDPFNQQLYNLIGQDFGWK